MSDRVARSAPLEPAPGAADGELEQKETKQEEVVGEVEVVGPGQALAERINASKLLPAGLKERLAEVAAADGGVEEAVRAVEETLPGVLRVGEREMSRPAHPAGEAFFRGDAGTISDEQAESIARGQLARSGMLRGQRVRLED